MSCIQCGSPTKKSTAKFCSLECKNQSQRGKRESLDPTKNIKCKIDGKIFDDYLNRSGILKKHSVSVLHKEFDWNDWEIISVETKDRWQCPYCEWSTVDVENKSGWITVHLENEHGMKPEHHCEKYSNDRRLWIEYWKTHSIEMFKQASENNRIQCKICGDWFRTITNTHLADHGYTVDRYKIEFGENSTVSKGSSDKLRMSYYEHRPELQPIENTPDKKYVRNIQQLQCKICNKQVSSVGISQHLKRMHNVDIDDYVLEHGEFRVNNIAASNRLTIAGDEFKCLICDSRTTSEKALSYHVEHDHGISKLEYVKQYIFKNIPKLCKCGCGVEVQYFTYKPYARDYVFGHVPSPTTGTSFSAISKEKMSRRAIERGVKGQTKKNTKPEILFENFLNVNQLLFERQVPTEYGIVDFYIKSLDLYVEIDGEYWHPEKPEYLNARLLSSCISQKRKSKIQNLCRIRSLDIPNLKSVDDLHKFNFVYDYTIDHNQIICSKEYLQQYAFEKKPVLVQYMLKFLREFCPEFPYPISLEDFDYSVDFIRNYNFEKMKIDDRVFNNKSGNVGVSFLKSIFRSYWNSSFENKLSPVEVWNDDNLMKKILSYRIGMNPSNETYDFTLHHVLRGISANRYTISFFKPMLAAAIYKNFLRDAERPVVFDPCAGFGGRMFGFKSVYPNGVYIGCEPNVDTFNELQALSEKFSDVILYNCKIEDFDLKLLNHVDLTFSSIPYYNLETYSNVTSYNSYQEWVDIFLGRINLLPNLLLNVPLNMRSEFGNCIEYFIESNTSHFDKNNDSKREYLLWFKNEQ